MAGTLRITRQQLAKFLGNDHDAIRQFETLFSTVADSNSTAVAAEPEIVVEVAAHEALARIERLERAFQMLELEPLHSQSVSDVIGLQDALNLKTGIGNTIDIPPIIPNAWDDEFPGTTLSSAWTKTDVNNIVSVKNGHLAFVGFGDVDNRIYKSISRPFKVVAKLVWATPHAISYEGVFLIFGATGGQSYQLGLQGRHADGRNIAVQSQRFTADGSWSSEIMWERCPSTTLYVSIEDTGTNLIHRVSVDGESWCTIRTEAYNAWCIVDYVGLCAGGVGLYDLAFYCEWIRRTV